MKPSSDIETEGDPDRRAIAQAGRDLLRRLEEPDYQARLPQAHSARQQKAPTSRGEQVAMLTGRGIPLVFAEAIVDRTVSDKPPLVAARDFLAAVQAGRTWALALTGPTGVGKTTAASWLVAQVWPGMQSARPCRRPRMIHSRDLAELNSSGLEEVARAPFVAVDDLGAGVDDDRKLAARLYTLVDLRWSAGRLPILITANMTGAELRAALDPRVVDRLGDGGRLRELGGQSLRGQLVP